MGNSDTVGDFATILRNGVHARKHYVVTDYSNLRKGIADLLKREGFIADYEVIDDPREDTPDNVDALKVHLKYLDHERTETPLNDIQRISKPGRRFYASADRIPTTRNGLGITVLTTSKGILSDREARKKNVGGELMLRVW